jgi:hypothetical protein
MAGKFIELKEAAAQLGISPEKLQDMREAGDVHGYKDGASWKFKAEEIERVAQELAGGAADDMSFSDSAALSEDDFEQLLNLDDAVEDDDLDNSSILISDEAGKAGHDSSSTIIGKTETPEVEEDLKLADESPQSETPQSETPPSDDDYELKLADSEDMSDELALSDDLDFESDAALALDGESDLGLAPDSDDDDVLAAESGSSEGELALGASDSGIANPSDSGLSLEGESAEALELPEDDDMISLDEAMVASPDDATQLQQDEEFLLSPSDSMLGDESSDSGSQVIALDDSSAFESDSDIGGEPAASEPLLVADDDALDVQLEPMDGAAAMASSVPYGAEAPEASYTAWNIMALLFVVLLLSVTGMLMADIVRNMWTWNSDVDATSGLAKSIIEALGM